MAIVTITGRFGAPRRQLGLDVARHLGADYVDHQVLVEASRRSGASMKTIQEMDDRMQGGKMRLSRFFQNLLERSATTLGDPFMEPAGVQAMMARTLAETAEPSVTAAQQMDDTHYVGLITKIVEDLAGAGNVVIIGKGAAVILRDRPNALHIFAISSEENRVKTVENEQHLAREAALKFVREQDSYRQAYYKKFFKVVAEDPALFHMFLNLDHLGLDRAARIVAVATRQVHLEPAQP